MMELKSEKTRRCELFRKHINQVLENQGDNADDEWWEDENAREELIRLSCAKEDCISDSDALRIESSEKLILAVYKKDEDLLFEQIVKKKLF
ncbi:MAG: hypothetical protein HFH30_12130 [Eubacterium sp.]|nr:hypothetical protein [Eubacterium sp.]MCI8917806.1 hypothetical protein [Eubacterium sp.]